MEGELVTPAGVYKASWKVKDGGSAEYNVEVPAGARATLMAGGKTRELGEGKYTFTI